ncbi:MAG: MaoC family dehydratase [Gammaproteobacteria bacterium]|nr:MAG: MaoC family dehydratase [Gammaproteobacteria bacterium]
MATAAEKAVEILQSQIGTADGHGDWITVDQDRINLFADATLDHQFIHIDPKKSAELSPYKVTIAHGFLTLSLIPHLTASIPQQNPEAYKGIVMGVNYGLDKVRFPNPVKVDSKVRAHRELMEVTLVNPNTVQMKNKITVEIDGEQKPGCVAEFLSRMIYS